VKNKDLYKTVVTEDGSISLFSSEFNELMHTKNGAYEEALIKHVYQSKVLETSSPQLNVLDIGFGTGYNILALLNEFDKQKKECFLNIYSLEYDKSSLPLLEKIEFHDERDAIYEKILTAFRAGYYRDPQCQIKIVTGDARQSVKGFVQARLSFDIFFQDPFSPAKNPELWSLDYFKKIYLLMSDTAILTTYSAAPQIRRAMLLAGMHIGKAVSLGKKKAGTLAGKKSVPNELSILERRELAENIKATPYRDEKLNLARQEILEIRIAEMKKLREKT
jgi:tRNA U34 5-methylaminomethyl-2-thiouridine-forming methyltransferase MnmC